MDFGLHYGLRVEDVAGGGGGEGGDDLELVEMAVGPAEGNLDGFVELGKVRAGWEGEDAYDAGGCDVPERDLEEVVGRHRGWLRVMSAGGEAWDGGFWWENRRT